MVSERKGEAVKLVTFRDIESSDIGMKDCVEWVAEAIKAKGDAILPPKISLNPGIEGVFANFMPCIVKDTQGRSWGGVKMVTRYPGRFPSLDSKLILFDADNGDVLALMDADWITTMRTGAVAAHSIDLLAKSDYRTISIVGLGNTARAALLALLEYLGGRDVDVRLKRYKGQEDLFMERFSGYDNLHFSCVDTYDELVRGADVVISAVTYIADDVCADDCFDEGVLVVPVHTRGFTNCDLFFDKVYADDRGHVDHFKNFDQFNQFAEVADVVNGRAVGRERDDERILVYNIGVAMHDIVFAAKLYERMDKEKLVDIDLCQPEKKFWV